VWHRRLVDDVSAVGPSIGARDREPEAGAVRSAARLDTARESVEQARDELALNALAAILNRDADVCRAGQPLPSLAACRAATRSR